MGKRRGYKKPRDSRSRTFAAPANTCHLCFLPIPPQVLSHDHPLYGTIDHIIPLSRGGRDTFDNRAPAHSFCNNRKGNDVELDTRKRVGWVAVIAELLVRVGTKCSNQMAKNAIGRILKIGDFYKYDSLPDLIRWEDDGGPAFPCESYHWKKPNSTR